MVPLKKPDVLHLPPLTADPYRPPTKRDPSWAWRGRYTAGGVTKAVSLGRGEPDVIAARALAAIARGLPGVGAATSAAPAGGTIRTVRELLGYWKAHQRKRMSAGEIEERSFLAYSHSVRRLANAEAPCQIGDVALEDVRSSTLEDYALSRGALGHAPKTINDDVSVFLMAWKWGRKRELGPERHLEPTPLKPRPVRPTRTPMREEILALMSQLPPRYALLVRLMYATGARVGEIAALEWADVDLHRRALRLGIHPGARKTGERVAAVHPEVVEALRAWAAREETPTGRGYRPVPPETRARWVLGVTPASAVSRLVKLLPRACTAVAAELHLDSEQSRITSHALRRWCATEMGRAGVSVKTAAAQQGHSPEMNVDYQRPTLEDQAAAVERAGLGVVGAQNRI